MTWKESFSASAVWMLAEGTRGSGSRRGVVGLAKFTTAGWYPACSKHGAMNRVGAEQPAIWRCLVEGCNIGAAIDIRGVPLPEDEGKAA